MEKGFDPERSISIDQTDDGLGLKDTKLGEAAEIYGNSAVAEHYGYVTRG